MGPLVEAVSLVDQQEVAAGIDELPCMSGFREWRVNLCAFREDGSKAW